MVLVDTTIPEVKIIEPRVFGDDRGFFMETYRQSWFDEIVPDIQFVQDNHSKSVKGTLRGLHYQLKNPQGKLVRVVQGSVYDVAVDVRKGSPTFGQHVGVLLDDKNRRQLWVPEGFAHGFYVVSDSAEFVYKCTDYYAPEHEHSILWNDPDVGIDWPLVDGQGPLLSEKDNAAALLKNAKVFD
ncbi:dTDP-4-dehydrorhamnose 3,5-epimerase [Aestuariibacter halophilus]|uniref:dTDP-4-dehydrorhamnose 3,5-epimerase n=1 Tax=Fluctibacter halophilus TaxID=226011 RepID=A0ABS8GAM6_9ALTE|nr:dTDP-4-dehydrorhamnose 3,5-epimerase [Aestuariibacter halophilus]MCC2617231.1 dTDP-4-dehydrorhamnose 3,5-epimerase [Aestuariibacter halophilus]